MKTYRAQEAVNYLLEERGIDYVLETHTAPDFVECVCSIGGDVITFRVYDRGEEFVVGVK